MKTAIDIFLFSVRLAVVHFILLLVAAMVDIIFLGFVAFTITCFAVAGIFSSVFCYTPISGKDNSVRSEKESLYAMIAILIVCVALFVLVGPLSGQDYELPVRSYAVTEAAATIFLYANQFHKEFEKP